MTFIASVVAKNGVAVIADSLVTTSKFVMELDPFLKYMEKKKSIEGPISIEQSELEDLFESKPSHTKNYEEKLFKYDDYTAITTAGSAEINGKRIGDLILELIEKNQRNKKAYRSKRNETKVKDFVTYFETRGHEQLKSKGRISATSFIFTAFNKTTKKTAIYKIEIKDAVKKDLQNDEFRLVTYMVMPDPYKVVCEGQNRISERILFGSLSTVLQIIPKIVSQIAKDHNLNVLDAGAYATEIFARDGVVDENVVGEMQIFQLSRLSLQQAIDLACLLMRIEMDFQKYTRDIPTVGGLIKLAAIDASGFRFISGNEITKPGFIR
jgi:hypothetical protein